MREVLGIFIGAVIMFYIMQQITNHEHNKRLIKLETNNQTKE